MIVLILAGAVALPIVQAQVPSKKDAKVTFYSNGSLTKAVSLPYTKDGSFYGAIFDGSSRLVFLAHGRFITFQMPAGIHVFSASYSKKHPAKNSQLSLTMKPSQEYFIRVDAAIGVLTAKGRLDEVTCQSATRRPPHKIIQ